MDDIDIVERTLVQLPHCHVFKVPTRRSAEGYRAADWPKDPAWTGKLKIVAKGRQAIIFLLDDKNNVFATCPVSEGAVEKTLDSGRYFVLRIENAQKKHAFIGLAFNERNDAFDFNVALQEHQNECEREDKAADMSEIPVTELKDMSIKEGEKIKVNLGGSVKPRERKVLTGGSGGLLAPPPRDSRLAPPPARSLAPPPGSATAMTSKKPVNCETSFEDFFSTTKATVPAPAPAASTSFDLLGDPFGLGNNGNLTTAMPASVFFQTASTANANTPTFDSFGFPIIPLNPTAVSTSATKPASSGSESLLDFNF